MASKKQIELSDYIKKVHLDLRRESSKLGADKAWENHLNDEETLSKYALSMEALSEQFWKPNVDSENDRFKFCISSIEEYFTIFNLEKLDERELEIYKKMDQESELEIPPLLIPKKLRLLDVGSSFNSFSDKEQMEVLALDISPANETVFKCDFLKVQVGSSLETEKQSLSCLPQNSYEVVVFSLLLDFLPSPEQRMTCCKKAYELLITRGILIIIHPDSRHEGANARLMKNWRYTLGLLGFSRQKIQKRKHTTCMIFRKACDPKIAARWSTLHFEEWMKNLISIPQDTQFAEEN